MVTGIVVGLAYVTVGFCYSVLYIVLDWQRDGRDRVFDHLSWYIMLVVGWPIHLAVDGWRELRRALDDRPRKRRVPVDQHR